MFVNVNLADHIVARRVECRAISDVLEQFMASLTTRVLQDQLIRR